MFPNKTNILQLASLMLQHGIRHVVLSPGSRNAPLIHTFTQHDAFTCYSVVDERSAAFFALGLIQKLQQPVAVCCTSGTALLNYGPAIAEAFYQGLPLLVISADRPEAWIGQADGQTIPQNRLFAAITKKSIQLPESTTDTDEWYCNRLVNEALIQLTTNGNGPVHVNVPLSEPLYEFSQASLPSVRKIELHPPKQTFDFVQLKAAWNEASKRMILIGQLPPDNGLDTLLTALSSQADVVLLAEHIGNVEASGVIQNFDLILASLPDEAINDYAPDLLITIGGHITSKRIKQILRSHTPSHHWDIRPDGTVKDTFQSITNLIPTDPSDFLQQLTAHIAAKEDHPDGFCKLWEAKSREIDLTTTHYIKESPFSDLTAIHAFLQHLPLQSALHLSSSAPIRYAQFCKIPPSIKALSNRGTNGIDGTVSTAVGYAATNSDLTFLLVGDLSFFYDINGLWNKHLSNKLRILLVNNGGGNMFHLIKGPHHSEALASHIACHHTDSAKDKALAFGMQYLSAANYRELHETLPSFYSPDHQKPLLLEVFTDKEINEKIFRGLFDM